MLKSAIDHLVVTANSRESGIEFVTKTLGVTPQRGGEHPRMGTHNALLRLGEALYLEVISVDPNAPVPPRPRWFGLDDLTSTASPRLAAWVARTSDIRKAVKQSPFPLGPIETMTRESFVWQITIPPAGKPLLDGAAPSLIEWSSPLHPAQALPDVGCSLEILEVEHSQGNLLKTWLREIGFEGPVTISLPSSAPSGLRARIRTPNGMRVLGHVPEES